MTQQMAHAIYPSQQTIEPIASYYAEAIKTVNGLKEMERSTPIRLEGNRYDHTRYTQRKKVNKRAEVI